MLVSTQKLIAAFKKRRQFIAKTTGAFNPSAEAVFLKHDIRRIGGKKQRELVLFNFE